jgi:Zn-dependent protease
MSALVPTVRPRARAVVVARRPVPIVLGKGSLVPVVLLAALFAVYSSGAQTGLLLGAAVLGGVGGAVSLIVHELGHVRAAQRLKGVRPVRISLVWMGAGTHFEGAYRSGRDQARVAIAGPAASLAFAVLLVVSALLPMPRPVALGLFGLAFLNVAIALVSLLPVHPLDGHKLLVGLLWRVVGSEGRARTILRRAGKAWLGVEVVGCAVLIVENPLFGSCVLAIGVSLYVQKQLSSRPARPHRRATRRPTTRPATETLSSG